MLSFLKRQCEACTVCCSAVGVEELGKPYFIPCVKLCEMGCSIHGKAPPSCQSYQCLWLAGELSFDQRPDRCGYLIHVVDDEGPWIEVFILRDNINTDKLQASIIPLMEIVPRVRFIRYDQVMNVAYPINHKTYPNMSNVGNGTQFETTDHVFFFLKAPKRISLPVVS